MFSKIILLSCLLALTAPINNILEKEKTHHQSQGNTMLQLYIYRTCPYCVKVINFLKQHNLLQHVELIDAQPEAMRSKLKSISGKTQAPFLVDIQADVAMPESDDIIAYLKEKFKV